MNYTQPMDTVVCFDPESNSWERPVFSEESGGAPAMRVGMTMTALDNEKAAIIGGYSPNAVDQDPADTSPKKIFNDVNILICEKGVWKWQEASQPAGETFTPRARHAACLIPVGKKVVVFGGMTSQGNVDSTSGLCRKKQFDCASGSRNDEEVRHIQYENSKAA